MSTITLNPLGVSFFQFLSWTHSMSLLYNFLEIFITLTDTKIISSLKLVKNVKRSLCKVLYWSTLYRHRPTLPVQTDWNKHQSARFGYFRKQPMFEISFPSENSSEKIAYKYSGVTAEYCVREISIVLSKTKIHPHNKRIHVDRCGFQPFDLTILLGGIIRCHQDILTII